MKSLLYSDLAKYYDAIYSWKDYKKEVMLIKKLINKHKQSSGSDLLDVACGTGKHLQFLKNDFSCTGIDLNSEMIKIAKKNVKNVKFMQGNMKNFQLNKQFDVVTCLFGSIGYLSTYSSLEETVQNFAKHLKSGGILIMEHWNPKSFVSGRVSLHTYSNDDLKIARTGFSKLSKGQLVLEMRYLVAEKNKGIRHFSEKHSLGNFDVKKTLAIMKKAGFKAKMIEKGIMQDRDTYIGIKR